MVLCGASGLVLSLFAVAAAQTGFQPTCPNPDPAAYPISGGPASLNDAFVFVSATGNDANPGTATSPKLSLAAAVAAAATQSKSVGLATGETFSLSAGFAWPDGVGLYGGYTLGASPSRLTSSRSTISVGGPRGITFSSATSQCNIFSQLIVNGGAATGSSQNAEAFFLTSSYLSIFRTTIVGGTAGDGNDGSVGIAGAAGGNGGAGGSGCSSTKPWGGSTCSSGCSGGSTGAGGSTSCPGAAYSYGGSGGIPTTFVALGNYGSPGVGTGAGLGGPGVPPSLGDYDPPSTYWGTNGATGGVGADASNTAATTRFGANGLAVDYGSIGGAGLPGIGGGGGGGGGGGPYVSDSTVICYSAGGGGGGGGAGGCGGTGGTGGASGGGSFAVYASNSEVVVEQSTLAAGNGGKGGRGGQGGAGGTGGVGGNCGGGKGSCYNSAQKVASNGARGGNGGNGGTGGYGSFGEGGPSIAVVLINAARFADRGDVVLSNGTAGCTQSPSSTCASRGLAAGQCGKNSLSTTLDCNARPVPTITSIQPSAGYSGGLITLTGTNFAAPAEVWIGNLPCTALSIVSSTTATCNVPTTSYLGAATVRISANQIESLPLTFRYLPFLDVAPNSAGSGQFAIGSASVSLSVPALSLGSSTRLVFSDLDAGTASAAPIGTQKASFDLAWSGGSAPTSFSLDISLSFSGYNPLSVYELYTFVGWWRPSGSLCTPPVASVVTSLGAGQAKLDAKICHLTPFVFGAEPPTQSQSMSQSLSQSFSQSQTAGDPHFRGLAGQKYLISGEPGTVYNIISTPSLLVNALFGTAIGPHRYTVMHEIGIVVGTDTIFANKNNRLQLNGKKAPASAVLSDGVSVLTRDINKTGDGITLRTPEFFLRWEPLNFEIDLSEVKLLRAGDATVHGLLGQTWNSGKWPASALTTEITDAAVLFPALLDGSGESDYAVQDGLFGHEFGFSTFDSGAYPEVHAAPAVSKAGRNNK